MRLLDKSKKPPTFEEVGLGTAMQARLSEMIHRPTGALLVTGPTGSGKSTTLVRRAGRDQPAGDQRDHRRGPGRVPARRHEPGADQPARRADVRDGAALHPSLRPRHRDGRRDPRRRDREDLDRGGPDGPLRPLDAAHERRAGRADPPERDGRRAVPDRLRRSPACSPSASRGGSASTARSSTRRARTSSSRHGSPRSSRHGKIELFRRNGCVRCRQTGYRGRVGVFQFLEMNEDLSVTRGTEGEPRGARARSRERRDATPLGRRDREGRRRPHLARRARARHDHLTLRRRPLRLSGRARGRLGRGAGAPAGAFVARRAGERRPARRRCRRPLRRARSGPGIGRAAARCPARGSRAGRRPRSVVGASERSSRPGPCAERFTFTLPRSCRSGTRPGARFWARPIAAFPRGAIRQGGSSGARRRGRRSGSRGRLGGTGRSLPAPRRARRGSRAARGRRTAGAAALGVRLLPRRALPGAAAGVADHARAPGSVDRRVAEGRRSGRVRYGRSAVDSCARTARLGPTDFREWCGSAAFKVADARALFESLGDDLEEIGVAGRPCFVLAGDGSFPEPSHRGAAAAGVRRVRDGIPRARPARPAARARPDRDPRPRPLRRACGGPARARRRDRRRSLGAPEARQTARAGRSARTPGQEVGSGGAPARGRASRSRSWGSSRCSASTRVDAVG